MPAKNSPLFTKLFRRTPTTIRHPKPNHTRLAVHQLEDRHVPAASLIASLNLADHVLRVEGTDGADDIQVYQPGNGGVSMSGVLIAVTDLDGNTTLEGAVPEDQIARIEVNGLGGDDSIYIGNGGVAAPIPVVIDAGDGNDTIYVQAGASYIDAGAGNDMVQAGDGNNTIIGGDGDDSIYSGAGDDSIDAGAGNDYVFAGAGNDTLYGGEGNDYLAGGLGGDVMYGQGGNDVLTGDNGTDTGADGGDLMDGGDGDDYLFGEAGNDTLEGGNGSDVLYGRAGDDVLTDTGTDGASNELYGDDVPGGVGSGNDTLTVVSGINYLDGGPGDDSINGGAGDDTLYGRDGINQLAGGAGVNTYADAAGLDMVTDPVLTNNKAMTQVVRDKWAALGGAGGYLGLPTADDAAAAGGGRVAAFAGGSISYTDGTYALASSSAIQAKYADLGGANGILGRQTADEVAVPGGRMAAFQNGRIYWVAATGRAQEVHGAIMNEYDATASLTDAYGKRVQDILGLPTSDEQTIATGKWVSHFQHGDIYALSGVGSFALYGAIKDKYNATASMKDAVGRWVQDVLGLPISEEVPTANGGRVVHFQGGDIYALPGVGAYVVYGTIRTRYNALGGPGGLAGLPTTDELAVPGGRVGRFAGADLYAVPNVGVFFVKGSIRVEYNRPGLAGILGLPTTDENAIPGGWYNDFQNGSIYALAAAADHQAHEVHGPIRDRWAAIGGAQGLLGFPTTDQFTGSDGWPVSTFENGTISWRSGAGGSIGTHLGFDRNQVIGALKKSVADGWMDTVEFGFFHGIATDPQISVPDPVRNLTYKLIEGDPANAMFQGKPLGNLSLTGSPASKVNALEQKWFEGKDHPYDVITRVTFVGGASVVTTIDGGKYSQVTGPLFGTSGPLYSDIYQGSVGDCIYLAPLAEVAARSPTTIRDMFINNGDGTYTVRFFHNGVADYLTVDDQLPTGGTVFARPTAGPIWAALVEKALVQLNESGWLAGTKLSGQNSYGSLDFGNSTSVESTLTALSGRAASTNGTDIGAAWLAGKMIVLGTGTPANNQIVANHDYAVIGAQFGPTPATTWFRLFNPWGENGGTGSDGKFKPGELWINQDGITANFAYATWTGAAPAVGVVPPTSLGGTGLTPPVAPPALVGGPNQMPPADRRADDRQPLTATIDPNSAPSPTRPIDPVVVATGEVAHTLPTVDRLLPPADRRADDRDPLTAALDGWAVALDV
jgi:uncharacterized protein with LGFP repeats